MEKSNVDVRVEDNYLVISIYIKDVLHLCIKKEYLVGIQSWGFAKTKKYCIEYTLTQGKNILSEYTSRQIWKDILDGLDNIIE